MVRGLEIFRDFFKGYESSYVLIGGAACDYWLSDIELTFRVTKDLDVVIVIEALDRNFVSRFHEFVHQGKYENKQKSAGERRYYRFIEPLEPSYPQQLELFSRNSDAIIFPDDQEITPIPVDEDLSSLSAIIMDENYYGMIMKERRTEKSLSLLSPAGLICLKMHAWLDLTEKKLKGAHVDSDDIKKHKNDVFKLFFALPAGLVVQIPTEIRNDVSQFLEKIQSEPWDVKNLGKNMGIPKPPAADVIIQSLEKTFGIR
jgi:hypothetical protein